MPRSHQTPVESWPLAFVQPGLLPSAACKASALAPCHSAQEVILLSTTILISGLNNAACILTTPRLRTSIAGLVRGFVTDLLARLWSGGTRSLKGSHPLGNIDEFHEIPLNPNVSDLLVASMRLLGGASN